MSKARERAKMPQGSAPILESRTLQKDYRTLVPVLKEGLNVLDIGCGTGSISKGIAEALGKSGSVTSLDSSEHLIERGKELYEDVTNLHLVCGDLFAFEPKTKFDLVVSARVLQWLSNPKEALLKIKSLLKPGGMVSILDYDHTALEWHPQPPKTMLSFYQAFLDWRSDAGMNNQIAEDLPDYLTETGFDQIEVMDANEAYLKGDPNFVFKLHIWTKVAETRGLKLVEDHYITETQRTQAIMDYEAWIPQAESMIMKLKEVRGVSTNMI